MAGGKRRSKPGSRSSGGKPNNRDDTRIRKKTTRGGRGRGSGSSSSVGIRSQIFSEGGLLSDWQLSTPPRGRNPSANALKSRDSKLNKSTGNSYAYAYPDLHIQGGADPESSGRYDYGSNQSEPMILLNSGETQITAFVDEKPLMKIPNANITYDYNSDFVLGEASHRGLGFGSESEAMPVEIGESSAQMGDQEKKESSSGPLSSENEIDEMNEALMFESSSFKKNAGYLSIGRMKLYTEDVSDEGSDEGHGESSSLSDSGESDDSESDSSKCLFESGSDVDEDVVEDYLEGIGGRDTLMDAKWLVDRGIESVENEAGSDSSSSLEGTMEKLGGIALQDASKDYGMKKPTKLKPQINSARRVSCSPAVDDDLVLYKDVRSISGKSHRGARFPKSWPLEAQKSKRSRHFPGEKKKHRKEFIAAKRHDRMLRRGVDLEQINMKLEEIVSGGTDMYSFQPMHSRDCSQIRRLAAVYQLQSVCQGSGKKRFVTVARTRHTSMPSSSDKLRLEKLIGSFKDEADFAVVDAPVIRSGGGSRTPKVHSSLRNSANQSDKSVETGEVQRRKKVPLSCQPVSFVSCGMMKSDTAEVGIFESEPVNEVVIGNKGKVAAFEEHTKGFGSRMMAKMGFIEGRGLGKDGNGMAEPIEVVKRPKSLGLGMSYSESGEESERKNEPPSQRSSRSLSGKKIASSKSTPRELGAFERHTKGFGSKMMQKMGFVEGTGLGKNAQGIVNPLVAVRLPKSRGLGAKG